MREFPQRLTTLALPGELSKRAHLLHTRLRTKEATERDPVYLALIRQLPCLRCGLEPCGEAAHVRQNSAAFNKRGAMAKKPADRFTVPLCRDCHTREIDSQHKVGEALFWHRLGINPLFAAERLYAKRGDLVAMRAAALMIIAERG